jgi:hypothetical protein
MRFQQTGNRDLLMSLELDQVLEILQSSRPRNTPSPVEKKDLLSSIASTGQLDADQRQKLIEQWDLTEDEVQASVATGDSDIVISAHRRTEDEIISPGGGQILCTIREHGAAKEHSTKITDSELLQVADETGLLLQDSSLLESVREFVTARKGIAVLAEWGEKCIDLMLLREDLRQSAEAYLSTWRALADKIASQGDVAHVDTLRQMIAAMDADWERAPEANSMEFEYAVLYSIHPYVLGPCLELINYVLAAEPSEELDGQINWALDRILPAYPAIWAGTRTLVHKGGSFRPEYAVRAQAARPDASTTGGFADVIRSFVGLHPYAKHGLSLLIVDPPNGSGLPNACKTMQSSHGVETISTQVLHTDTGFVDWAASDSDVNYVGRIENLKTWAMQTPVRAHITFMFRAAHPGGTGSHPGDYAPSKGLQNALTFSLTAPPLGGGSDTRIPTVAIQPRNANDLVLTVMQLARATNREDRFFQVNPMLDPSGIEEVKAIAVLSDWLVVVTPSPIGLIPPRKFEGSDLVYLGREEAGVYSLFVYARDLFPVRKHLQGKIVEAPVRPNREQLEEQLSALATSVPNGVLRVGRTNQDVSSHIGLMASSFLTRKAL